MVDNPLFWTAESPLTRCQGARSLHGLSAPLNDLPAPFFEVPDMQDPVAIGAMS